MKNFKTIIILATLLFSAVSIHSDVKEEAYVIKKIIGKVQFENQFDKWQVVNMRTKLFPSTKISTGLNSSITFELENGKLSTIKAMKKDVIDSLLTSMTSGGSGIIIGAKVTESNIDSDTTKSRSNISTSSTRASSAVDDLEWVEDEEVEEKVEE